MRPEIRGKEFAVSPNTVKSLMIRATIRRDWLTLIGFVAILMFAWACYAPAISGAFQLDDYVNLAGLSEVNDTASALEFIFSGNAGPTGRPLALATFALQAEQWREGPAGLLRANILIHLVNAALLALALYQLSRQRAVSRYDAALVATAAAGLWVLMPLLATASLLVIQRMTTLSALFMFLGLNGYLLARSHLERRPSQALAGMSVSLVAGSVMAAFCKESGLLLPILVLVLEATVLDRPTGVEHRTWQIWKSIFLVSPLVLLLMYLLSWVDYPDFTAASRGFNAWERLLTEARVLWIYLAKAVVGIPSRLGIYQYPPTVSRSLADPMTFLACLGWIALGAGAIRWRRRFPLFSVAVLWYLAGHLIESTVVPLELYFEHRNYVPVIGPLFALGSFIVLHGARQRRMITALVTVLALVNAWFLYSSSTLSGHPSIASRYWAETYPQSMRAVSILAAYRLEEEGLIQSLQTIEDFVAANPEYGYLRLLQLNLVCTYVPDQDHRWLLEKLERELPEVDYTYTTPWMLYAVFDTLSSMQCNRVDLGTLEALATRLRSNPLYTTEPSYNQSYHMLLADIARERGEFESVIDHLEQAIKHRPSRNLNEMMVTALIDADDLAGARDFIEYAETLAPSNPIQALLWRRDLGRLRLLLQESDRAAQAEPIG